MSKRKDASPSTDLAEKIASALRKALPDKDQTYVLHEPQFVGREWQYVKQCIDTTMVSSTGDYVLRFEKMLEKYTGAKKAVAVVNGTAGLHIALKLAGVRPGDEVLVPALTFVATANAVSYCGATPHFVDSEERTLGIDPDKLEAYLFEKMKLRSSSCINQQTGMAVRAMLPMHAFGHPVRLKEIGRIARRFKITLIEDAAESIGSFYQKKHTGTFGKMGVLSFNGNKTITTGGGGAILTNDPELALQAKHLTTTAKLAHPWEYHHDAIGYNYRLTNLNAALGCAQIESLPRFLADKKRLFFIYKKIFKDFTDLEVFAQPDGCQSNYWLQTILLKKGREHHLEPILGRLHQEKILARPAWIPLHQLKPFHSCPRMNLEVVESLARRIINLPSSAYLGKLK